MVVFLLAAAAASSAGSDTLDYQQALRCMALATAMATTNKIGDQSPETVKNNREVSEKVVRDYLIVLRFEGKKLGKSTTQISDEYQKNAKTYSDEFFARKFKSDAEVLKHYNNLVAETNACGRAI